MSRVDVDAFVYRHRPAWVRLETLVRQRKLSGVEVDELIALYRRTSAHLARLHTQAADPAVLSGLSDLLARARARSARPRTTIGGDLAAFFVVRFPAAVYGAWQWCLGVAFVCIAIAVGVGAWVANSHSARAELASGYDIEAYTAPRGAFEMYYSEHPAGLFAAQVWTNNAWVSAIALFTGALLIPAAYVLVMNAVSIGVSGGLMSYAGRLDAFFGFILPHGILELTAVFVAGGAGLKLGWTLIDPGPLSRAEAVARQGRATAAIALGLVVVLFVSGVIEAFVTPSGLPTSARIAVGVIAELLFVTYVFVLGRAAVTESR